MPEKSNQKDKEEKVPENQENSASVAQGRLGFIFRGQNPIILFYIILIIGCDYASFKPFSLDEEYGMWGGFQHGFLVYLVLLRSVVGLDEGIPFFSSETAGFYWVGFIIGFLISTYPVGILQSKIIANFK